MTLRPPFQMTKGGWITIGLGVLTTLIVTLMADFGAGLVAGLAVSMVGVGYLIVRDPPPPNDVQGDPAALNFGMTDAKNNNTTTQQTTQQPQQRYRGPQRRR